MTVITLTPGSRRGESPQELDQRCIDFHRTFLLGPMTAAWEQERLLEMGNESTQVGYQLLAAGEVDDQVALPSDIESWGAHQSSRPCGHQFPAFINHTIPVESTAEARSLKFAR